MYIIYIYVFGFIINIIEIYGNEHSLERSAFESENTNSIKLNPKIIENRNELKRLINILNGRYNEEDRETDDELKHDLVNGLQYKEPTLKMESQVEEQVTRLKKLLSLLQNNYKHRALYKKELERPVESRIYFIDNPEVLEDFKRNLRRKHQSTSSSSSDYSDIDRSLKDNLANYRRETMFRINKEAASKEDGDEHRNNDEEDSLNASKSFAIEPRNRDSYKDDDLLPKDRFKVEHSRSKNKENGIRNNFGRKRRKSAELYDSLHKDAAELSWERVNESHEKFDRKRKEKTVKNYHKTKDNFKEKSKGRVGGAYKQKEYHNDRDTDKKFSSEKRKTKDTDVKEITESKYQPSRFKSKAAFGNYMKNKKQNRMPHPFGRTFIPSVRKKTIYEEEDV